MFVDGDVFFAGGFYFFEHVALCGVVMCVWDVGVEDLGISFQFVFCVPGGYL